METEAFHSLLEQSLYDGGSDSSGDSAGLCGRAGPGRAGVSSNTAAPSPQLPDSASETEFYSRKFKRKGLLHKV